MKPPYGFVMEVTLLYVFILCPRFDVEHAQCLTGYHVFMVSGLDLARAPRRARLTARKKGSGYENGKYCTFTVFSN